jgi:hypothetical protein
LLASRDSRFEKRPGDAAATDGLVDHEAHDRPDQPRLAAVAHDACHCALLRLAVRDHPVAPVHAPAAVCRGVPMTAPRIAAVEQVDQVLPALRRERLDLERQRTNSRRSFSR